MPNCYSIARPKRSIPKFCSVINQRNHVCAIESKEPLKTLSLAFYQLELWEKAVKTRTYWSETMIKILVVETISMSES
ncbi:hypothetical protein PAECIP111894_05261 [Paenibacillus pseudetheri]|uniref:Uncharacterized protein n=1 Tax=Paenibacillus pseudetheri TaxID=2897682 RepID=A0ABM9BKY1_9BACL|nr:hypothetical protein PAECIP111894_05261 [Paenibacillus pseudetheri]